MDPCPQNGTDWKIPAGQSYLLLFLSAGYFMIEGKLYCEVHARRVAEAPGDNFKYAGAVYR